MDIDMTGLVIKRDLSDPAVFDTLLTGTGITYAGRTNQDRPPFLGLEFTPTDPPESLRDDITIRIVTADQAEETLYLNVLAAITASRTWRTTGGAGATLRGQANTLAGSATLTQANLRTAFSQIRDTLDQLGTVMQRQEWLAEQMLKLMNKV